MHVIGHQAIGVQRAARLRAELAQIGEVNQPIALGVEARLAVIAALSYMQGDFRHDEAALTRHIGHNGWRREPVDGAK